MSSNGSDEPDQTDPKKKIEELKRKAKELTGDEMVEGESEECPPEVKEQFWSEVVAYENAPWTTHFKQLEEAGVQLPAPEDLNDEELNAKLWEIIRRLAFMRVFLSQTDHLTDRELYTHLWSDLLREETKDLVLDQDSACHLEVLGSYGEEDMHLYLKYYADEDSRRQWHEDWPEAIIPDHEDPPFDRDRYLPKPSYESPSGLKSDLPN
jgi:hypothetical protein